MIALVLILLQAAAAAQQPAAPARLGDPGAVRLEVRVQPETVTVGDRFNVFIRVRAPAGASIEFPSAPDSGAVELVTPPAVSAPTADTLWVQQTAGYRMTAWDLDSQPLLLGDVVVRSGVAERRVSLAGAAVFVRSVLPADTTLHVPKPAREPFTFALPGWVWWLLAALILLLLALLAWWLWRKLRRRVPALPPLEAAEREFDRIEALRLPDRDEGARHLALMTDVLREYLAARLEGVAPSQTSRQLLAAAAASAEARWDPAVTAGAARLLERADLAKFAALRIVPEEARALGAEARALVVETERRVTAPEERAAA